MKEVFVSIHEDVLLHPEDYDFQVETLGASTVNSPLQDCDFTPDGTRVLLSEDAAALQLALAQGRPVASFERAGARQKLFFDPAWTRVAILTAGGLSPGLNDVIKGIVHLLHFEYGVRSIYGIRYGYRGLLPEFGHAPIILTPQIVDTIHEEGGTILGSARGYGDRTGELVDSLQRSNINVLFCIGGDGTLRGASAMADEIKRRGLSIGVVGIPKTIDNDLHFVGRTFGFETAVYQSHNIISCAHVEANGTFNGIGLVKLMGRDSGFIAAYASLANSVVNFCLVPEVPFELDGPEGLLAAVERRFQSGKDHCVIVVAEGAGQSFMRDLPEQRDASGNVLKHDIGEYLRLRLSSHFGKAPWHGSVKYLDPSYAIRSVPALGTDAILCNMLAKHAVHAAMAGKTNCVVGIPHGDYALIPIRLATKERRKLNLRSDLWRAVLDATRQNDYFLGRRETRVA
jgi:6-phosphofructokinase 1